MKRIVAVLTALVLAAPVVSSAEAIAQTYQPGAPPAGPKAPAEKPQAPAPEKEQEIQGKIKSVDPSGKEVTLEDGTKLMLPDQVKVNRNLLKEGATVKARFKEEGGQKVVIRITVQPGKGKKS